MKRDPVTIDQDGNDVRPRPAVEVEKDFERNEVRVTLSGRQPGDNAKQVHVVMNGRRFGKRAAMDAALGVVSVQHPTVRVSGYQLIGVDFASEDRRPLNARAEVLKQMRDDIARGLLRREEEVFFDNRPRVVTTAPCGKCGPMICVCGP